MRKDFTLERLPYFSHIAWTLVVLFALFTGNLALQLITLSEVLQLSSGV